MNDNRSRQVLIRTLPLGHNYGGLLQAFALQHIVRQLGFEPETDDTQPPTLLGRGARVYMKLKPKLWKYPLTMAEVRNLANSRLLDFKNSHISGVGHHAFRSRPRKSLLRKYHAFIVGSDQVWRPAYGDVVANTFGFLDHDLHAVLLSYAASFGSSGIDEYTPDLRTASSTAVSRLTGVSVREHSGVEMVRQLWGRTDAQCHIDPTLLLTREDYDSLLLDGVAVGDRSKVVSYILDPSPEKSQLAISAATVLQTSVQELMRPEPPSIEAYRTDPHQYMKISVEDWLAEIRGARFLITDSFHGCVFAIIFRVPFAVVPNINRGTARFDSLLSLLQLNGRAISVGSAPRHLSELIAREPDWESASALTESERERSLSYLSSLLNRQTPT